MSFGHLWLALHFSKKTGAPTDDFAAVKKQLPYLYMRSGLSDVFKSALYLAHDTDAQYKNL